MVQLWALRWLLHGLQFLAVVGLLALGAVSWAWVMTGAPAWDIVFQLSVAATGFIFGWVWGESCFLRAVGRLEEAREAAERAGFLDVFQWATGFPWLFVLLLVQRVALGSSLLDFHLAFMTLGYGLGYLFFKIKLFALREKFFEEEIKRFHEHNHRSEI